MPSKTTCDSALTNAIYSLGTTRVHVNDVIRLILNFDILGKDKVERSRTSRRPSPTLKVIFLIYRLPSPPPSTTSSSSVPRTSANPGPALSARRVDYSGETDWVALLSVRVISTELHARLYGPLGPIDHIRT